MNQPTYVFILLSKPPLHLRGWLKAILLFIGIGILPNFCFAHYPIESDSIELNRKNRIIKEQKTKIYIVKGTVVSNLENSTSAEVISISPVKKEVTLKNIPKNKEKKKDAVVVTREKEKYEKSQKSIVQPFSGKESFSLGSKNVFGIPFPRNSLKKFILYLNLNDFQEFKIPFDTVIHKISFEKVNSFLFFYGQTTRPPPYWRFLI